MNHFTASWLNQEHQKLELIITLNFLDLLSFFRLILRAPFFLGILVVFADLSASDSDIFSSSSFFSALAFLLWFGFLLSAAFLLEDFNWLFDLLLAGFEETLPDWPANLAGFEEMLPDWPVNLVKGVDWLALVVATGSVSLSIGSS